MGKNYLGIDWGKEKIGLALAHAETRVALALYTLANDEELIKNLLSLIERENIGTAVIGVTHRRGQGQGVSFPVKLGKQLQNSSLSVVFVDEMFTTKLAQERLKKYGEKNIGELDDPEAARILLEDWLTRKNPTRKF